MYEELIIALRGPYDSRTDIQLMKQAADAIEELNSQLDDFKRLCLPLKENRLYKYSDGIFVKVFLILPSEITIGIVCGAVSALIVNLLFGRC